jgi:hypothetical protein
MRKVLTVKELKEIIKDVPDDYECTIMCEDQNVHTVEVDDETKTVDFSY